MIERGKLYSESEVIKLLGLESTTLANAHKRHGLKLVSIGNVPVILGDWVIDWVLHKAGDDATREQLN